MQSCEIEPGMSVTVKSIERLKKEFGRLSNVPGRFCSPEMDFICGVTLTLPQDLPRPLGEEAMLIYVKDEYGNRWGLTAAMLEPAIPLNKQGLDEFSRLMDGLLEES